MRWDMTLFTCAVILVSIFTIFDPVCPTFAQLHQFASPWQIKGGGSRGGGGATSLELRSHGSRGPQTPSHPRTSLLLVYNRFYINLSKPSHLTHHPLPHLRQLDQLFCPQLQQGLNKQKGKTSNTTYFADFVRKGGIFPPPLYGQNFRQKRSYGHGGVPPPLYRYFLLKNV